MVAEIANGTERVRHQEHLWTEGWGGVLDQEHCPGFYWILERSLDALMLSRAAGSAEHG